MTILITGSAGFIGFHLCKRLINSKEKLICIDNFNDYYDINLKNARADYLSKENEKYKGNYKLIRLNICDKNKLNNVIEKYSPKYVVHLAAQPGVRYSLENPESYINNNLVGFSNILESCRNQQVKHLLFASSSAVYGGNINIPFKEIQSVDHPINLYAATKKSNELMAHVYSHLFNLPVTGVRFFTVYGPWGRPDMALSLFIKAILNKELIQINGNGAMQRDFTYIEDIIEGLTRLIKKIPNGIKSFDKENPNPSQSWAPYRIFNMGNSKKELLSKYIAVLEDCLGQKALKEFHPVQPGEMFSTESSNDSLQEWIDFKPNTPIEIGIKKFVDWYRDFYKI